MTTAVAEERRLLDLGRGAERELERLYRCHADDVRRYVHSVLRNPSDAEDATQQTFLKALRALQSGTRPERPRQWLLAIAHNECLMHFRAEARRPAQVALEEAADRAEPPAGPRAADIREALSQLRPAQRAALVMRELEGRAYSEIAAALGVSGAAVETLLFRARRALREQFEGAAGCHDTAGLLAAETLTETQRRFLRAHLRSCPECSTLERRRRGKLSAVRRIASLLPMPGWFSSLLGGGGKAAVAVAVAAAAAGGTVEVVTSDATPRHTAPPPVLVHRDAVLRPARSVPAPAPVARVSAKPAARHIVAPVSRVPRAQVETVVAPAVAPAVEPPAPQPAAPVPAASPPTDPAPPPAEAVTVSAPTVTVPPPPPTDSTGLTDPVAAVPVPELPSVTTPSVTVATVTVPSVTVPSLTDP